ncbi:glycerate kinase [Microbacterium amylolyticum]|uniref:Glycerate kinase n=1 Tax=Microbacterium amylolyticum TaxID=936337 RepID=A0ABS4ZKA2_9MICO|nr:glycerate kinase [Microbacterium amylolyticum]MBP2437370.1 glycerate kinase [Microbacterium amylolyticum]
MTHRRVVIAPDSFKGTATAADVAVAIAEGWVRSAPADHLDLRPMADGGEGTLDAFEKAVPGATRVAVRVTGPTGFPVDASWLRLPATDELPGGTGVVELASTCGIELLGEERCPWDAATLGFGQAIVAALDAGISRLILGIGSSASTDGGAGLLTALGARFLGNFGASITSGARGLTDLARVDVTGLRALPAGGVLVLSDVTNPLTGPRGAAAVFGPQKGLTAPDDIARVDDALARLAGLVGRADLAGAPGAGAAGGTGFALLVWGAQLTAGAEEISHLTDLADAIGSADVVVTGEGKFDGQSAAGKVPSHVAGLAGAARIPVALVAGQIDGDTTAFRAAASLTDIAGSSDAAMADTLRWLRDAGEQLAAEL